MVSTKPNADEVVVSGLSLARRQGRETRLFSNSAWAVLASMSISLVAPRQIHIVLG